MTSLVIIQAFTLFNNQGPVQKSKVGTDSPIYTQLRHIESSVTFSDEALKRTSKSIFLKYLENESLSLGFRENSPQVCPFMLNLN